MPKMKFSVPLLFLILITTLMSCRSAPVKSEPVAEAPISAPVKVPSNESSESRWQGLIEAAQREGKVVVYAAGWGQTELTAISNGFKAKYGISVETVTGRGPEIAEKVLREQKAGLHLADIFVTGTQTGLLVLKPADILASLDPVFLLPELTQPEVIKKTWLGEKLKWVDADHRMIQILTYPSFPVVINADLVKPGEITSYKDLLSPKWKGKIVVDDPSVNGPGAKWFSVAGAEMVGWDFMRELARQQEIIVSRDWRQEVEWVAQGKKAIVIAPLSTMVVEFQKAGAPLKEIEVSDGVWTTQGSWGQTLLKEPAHFSAANLMANWLLTMEGLTIVSKAVGRSTTRLDVPVDFLPPEQRLQVGKKYLDGDDEKFILKQPEYLKMARDIFGPLMK